MALCALNNLILSGLCSSFSLFEMCFPLEYSLTWKYFYEQCVEEYSLRSNEQQPATSHNSHIRQRHCMTFISLPIHSRACHIKYAHIGTRCVCVATVCWNSFICIQRTEICYCFFRFNFPFGDFQMGIFFLLFSPLFFLSIACDSLLSVFEKRMMFTLLVFPYLFFLILYVIPGQWPNGIHIIKTNNNNNNSSSSRKTYKLSIWCCNKLWKIEINVMLTKGPV